MSFIGLIVSAYVQFEDTGVHVASGIVIPILVVGWYAMHLDVVNMSVLSVCCRCVLANRIIGEMVKNCQSCNSYYLPS